MIILAGYVLLASACTSKQVTEKTASGLNPADFRMEVDGKQTDLFVLKNKMVWKFVLQTLVDVLYQ